MNIIKKELYEPATVELEYFYILYNSFLGETPLNTHQKTIAVPRHGHDTVFP